MLTLTLHDAASGEKPRTFHERAVTIGRRDGNTLVLDQSHISSRHAVIKQRNDAFFLADLDSTNGSLVEREGQQILLGPRGRPELKLQQGDTLVLGDIDQPVRLEVTISRRAVRRTMVGETVVATRVRTRTVEINRRVSADHVALTALYRMVEAVNGLCERDVILHRVAETVLEAVPGAVDVLVAARDAITGQLETAAKAHRGEGVANRPNRKICQEALAGDQAVLFGEHDASSLPAETLVSQGVGSGIAAPIVVEGQGIGVLQINCQPGRLALAEQHLDLAVVLAHHAGQALERAELLDQLKEAQKKLSAENFLLRRRTQPEVEMVAEAPVMAEVLHEVRQAAAAEVTVLIQGETGTGKEVTARYLHASSRRSGGLLVPVNCGALSETLLDSELFGYRKGAFTGAAGDRKGVFEVARGGTVFLDEIGETPPAVQVRLLRVLEEGKIKVLGDAVEKTVDVRIVAASNRDLAKMVEEGSFRRDLYYRLRVFPITLPPLRRRPEDVGPLCDLFTARFSRQLGKSVAGIDPGLVQALQRYAFPGNVRELANEIERAMVRADEGQLLTADLLSEEVLSAPPPSAAPDSGLTLRDQVASFEREIIGRTLARYDGKKIPAAKQLGLTRQGLSKKMERLGIKGLVTT